MKWRKTEKKKKKKKKKKKRLDKEALCERLKILLLIHVKGERGCAKKFEK